MSYIYELDDLYLLKSAIIKKDNGSKLTLEEEKIYNDVVFDIYSNISCDVDNSILFNACFYRWYVNKDNLLKEDLEIIDDLLIFKGLLHFKGKTVSLKELYDYTYGDYYSDKYDLMCEADRKKFLERLNGCLAEARVVKLDTSRVVPRELLLDRNQLDYLSFLPFEHKKISLCDQIDVKVSKVDDPLLFISSLQPCDMKKIQVEDGEKFTFISISDLHLGGCLIDNHGLFYSDGENILKERLESFVAFKNKIIEDLNNNNIKVNGIFFIGDTFDGVVRRFDTSIDRDVVVTNLEESRNRIYTLIKEHNQLNGHCLYFDDSIDLVGCISGNHDNTLGKELFTEFMKAFSEDIIFLGDGAGRIKINDEYILFSHPNSWDWGLPVNGDFFQTRRKLECDIFHFDEYFGLCEREYNLLKKINSLYILGDTPRIQIKNLVDMVNENLRRNNLELYNFYEPFITRGNGSGESLNPSCFESMLKIGIDVEDNSTYLKKDSKVEYGFSIKNFFEYCNANLNIRQMLNERPVYFNSGNLAESLSIIGHFHTRLEGGKRVCHAFEDGNGNDGVLPVIIEDGSSFRRGNDDIFSATVCSLEIKDGVIDKIEIEPAIYVVKKDNNDYNALRMMGTTSSVYVRKKTL